MLLWHHPSNLNSMLQCKSPKNRKKIEVGQILLVNLDIVSLCVMNELSIDILRQGVFLKSPVGTSFPIIYYKSV